MCEVVCECRVSCATQCPCCCWFWRCVARGACLVCGVACVVLDAVSRPVAIADWVLYILIYYILIIARRQAPAQGEGVWGLERRDELQERRGHAGDPRGQQRAYARERLPPGSTALV